MTRVAPFALFVALAVPVSAADRPDLVVADFESETYGDWKAEGTAFGAGPAKGTLPGQMHVEGYEGKRLVNTFAGGDDSTGTLVSPPFKIERTYLNFLIGGGKHPGETCIDLLVDGKPARSATGPNDRPGGSERLDWHTWDVSEFAGREAVIRIVDHRKGGWGHVNVDQIVQSDTRRQAEPASREIAVEEQYLQLPVKNGAPKRRLTFVADGKTVREFEIELAEDLADFSTFADVSAFKGKTLRVEADALPAGSKALDLITVSNGPDADRLYSERLRPQFHFTSRRGWLNDPNGLVYADGEWHLFYQHNPFGTKWGNMHWGHAVSGDLVHWNELGEALYPHGLGDMAFSGSAVVDEKNTSGFGAAGKPPLVLAYTSTGRGECVAYSNDRGRTWTEFDGNPVVRHRGRDPKLIPHPSGAGWSMAVYDEADDRKSIAFYSSPDLKNWKYESRIDGFYECPDLFELKTADGSERKWVLYAADGEYMLSDFDGKAFKPSSGKHKLWHGNFYAAQTFDHAPDGRRIQIGWGRGIEFPGMPFNQQMTVPVELKLVATNDGPRMTAVPVEEIKSLRKPSPPPFDEIELKPGQNLLFDRASGRSLDVETKLDPGTAESVTLGIGTVPIRYDAKKHTLTCRDVTAPVDPQDGVLTLRMLVDRGSVEVFANGGRVAMSVATLPEEATPHPGPTASASGGTAKLREFTVYEMKSAWRE